MSAIRSDLPARLTAAEFYALPDSDDYRHSELIDGEVVVNPPSLLHQRILTRLLGAVDSWTQGGPARGEVTTEPAVQINAGRVYVPDLAWWPSERTAPPDQPPAFSGPPALIAEVLSPSTRTFDATRKASDYARIGVKELWLIDSDPLAAQIHRSSAGGAGFALVEELGAAGTLTSPLLPSLAVALETLARR